jgi:hypothetical protein
VGPRAGLKCAETLGSNGIRSPDIPARSKSLYRLAIPAHGKVIEEKKSILPAGIKTELVLKSTKKNKEFSDTECRETRNIY